jgi:hypothetical protein
MLLLVGLLVTLCTNNISAQDAPQKLIAPTSSEAYNAPHAIRCRLVIKGGTNNTQVVQMGTSIAHAELSCTGGTLMVAVHPVLQPFAANFTGVVLSVNATVPEREQQQPASTGQQQGPAAAAAAAAAAEPVPKCMLTDNTLLSVCGLVPPANAVIFERAEVSDIISLMGPILGFFGPRAGLANDTARLRVAGTSEATAVMIRDYRRQSILMWHFEEPVFSNIEMVALDVQASVTVRGGVFHNTRGVSGLGRLGFEGTQLTHNWATTMGSAVAFSGGIATFTKCVFDSNRAVTLHEATQGHFPVHSVKSGTGGAILATLMRFPIQLSFTDCTFVNNSAVGGGAVALTGAKAAFQNCTFHNNTATRSGADIHADFGTRLSIKDSSIRVDSPTVVWERGNASECLRGEFFGAAERLCRRCLPATFSLREQTNASDPQPENHLQASCSPCPQHAQVRAMPATLRAELQQCMMRHGVMRGAKLLQ